MYPSFEFGSRRVAVSGIVKRVDFKTSTTDQYAAMCASKGCGDSWSELPHALSLFGGVRIARQAEDFKAIAGLRRQAYGPFEANGYESMCGHANYLFDRLDCGGINLLATDRATGTLQAGIRLNLLPELTGNDFCRQLISQTYGSHQPSEIVVASRLFRSNVPGSTRHLNDLLKSAFLLGILAKKALSVTLCKPGIEKTYLRYGYRVHSQQDARFITLILPLYDSQHFQRIGSPFLSVLEELMPCSY